MIDARVLRPPLILLLPPARNGQQDDLRTVVGTDAPGDVGMPLEGAAILILAHLENRHQAARVLDVNVKFVDGG